MPAISEGEFGEFYRTTARPVWTYVYHAIGNAADADDIVQDAFCRLLRADGVPESAEDRRRYLFRIASNLIADRWRRHRRDQGWFDRLREALTPAPAPEADSGIVQVFGTLKPRDRALLWLAYVEGQTHEQIADALGLSRGSIKVLLSRARARLRQVLEPRERAARA